LTIYRCLVVKGLSCVRIEDVGFNRVFIASIEAWESVQKVICLLMGVYWIASAIGISSALVEEGERLVGLV
jgi:hypothetical protein